MLKLKKIFCILLVIQFTSCLFAQNLTQTIRGRVVDKDAQFPLIGANVAILSTSSLQGTSTDIDGDFKIKNISVGRHNIEITYLGYEPVLLNNILVTSGKELVLTVELTESATQLNEVVVRASKQIDKTKPLNEFATLSARTFSVEETSRYAFSAFDPARMAQNYAGVSVGAGSDLFNEIVIRGNSPTGVLWRLEGIQIPNPNHFGAIGNSGGAISMLSSSTLSNSDFYTGAFPSEFGNALSGVFDLNLRTGNNEKRETAIMFGLLGIELATEGPFRRGSKASYLINYRYSTLAALERIGLSPAGDILPAYQDLSFKINIPTKKAGVFSIFGLGGNNTADEVPERDSTIWKTEDDRLGSVEEQATGSIGLTHRILFANNSYLRTVLIASYESIKEKQYLLETENDYIQKVDFQDDISSNTFRLSSTYNQKFNSKNTFRAGVILSNIDFRFLAKSLNEERTQLISRFDNKGESNFIQAFASLKHRLKENLTLNVGLHSSLLTLNNASSFEPRAALQWQTNPQSTWSASVGLHSRMEHLAIYLFEGASENGTIVNNKKNLGLTKALHAVVGYDHIFNPNLRIKAELYYQKLYNVPVGTESNNTISLLNASDVWRAASLPEAVSEGTGRNIGLDLTLEKFFNNQYYFLVSGSLYDSRYTPKNNQTYSTSFNGNYQFNFLGGKEFSLGKNKNKQNIFGINGKFILSGGNRYTPIDLEASKLAGKTISILDRSFENRTDAYYRVDLGISFRVNKARMTHTFMLDIQNVTNRLNTASRFYNPTSEQIEVRTQTGLFPNFNYRMEF